MPNRQSHIIAREYDWKALQARETARQHEQWAINACKTCGCEQCVALKRDIEGRPN